MKLRCIKYNREFSKDVYRKDYVYPYLNRVFDGLDFSSCLEVGCGSGNVLKYLSDRYGDKEFCGCDISSVGVGVCKDQGLDVVCCSGDDLTYVKKSFDIVFTHFALEQMKYMIGSVCGELYRVCIDRVFCVEPVFCLQNFFGKLHNWSMDYVKGLPFFLEMAGFSIDYMYNMGVGKFYNRACLVSAGKV